LSFSICHLSFICRFKVVHIGLC